MSEFQKIIKYFAIALAMFLIFSIISGISFGLSLVGNIFDGNDSEVLEDVLELVEIEDNINVLDISVNVDRSNKETSASKAHVSERAYDLIKQTGLNCGIL